MNVQPSLVHGDLWSGNAGQIDDQAGRYPVDNFFFSLISLCRNYYLKSFPDMYCKLVRSENLKLNVVEFHYTLLKKHLVILEHISDCLLSTLCEKINV